MSNLQKFLDTYKKSLEAAHKAHPEAFVWTFDELETVFGRMENAIKKGTFNKDSESFKMTCKELGIKNTYKAIDAFIKG